MVVRFPLAHSRVPPSQLHPFPLTRFFFRTRSLSSQDGDPFAPDQHFNLTSVDLNVTGPEGVDRCQNATTYDGLVHSCLNTGAVQLGVFLCPFNAAA